jgi:hypothetical protein
MCVPIGLASQVPRACVTSRIDIIAQAQGQAAACPWGQLQEPVMLRVEGLVEGAVEGLVEGLGLCDAALGEAQQRKGKEQEAVMLEEGAP